MELKIEIKDCKECPYGYTLDDYIISEKEPYCRVEDFHLTNVECPNIKDGKRVKLLKEQNNEHRY